MIRTATCHCGQLQVTCQDEPTQIFMCHCELCQRRTGTTYNLAAWFGRAHVTVTGDEHLYRRTGDTGTEFRFHFCPTCGTNLYWESGSIPDAVGVAVGCFMDPQFPGPTISLYGKRRHAWVPQLAGIPSYSAGMDSELE